MKPSLKQRIFSSIGILVWATSCIVGLVQRFPREGTFFERYTWLYLGVIILPCLVFTGLFVLLFFTANLSRLVEKLYQSKVLKIAVQIILLPAVVVGVIWVFRIPTYLEASWVFLVAVLLTPFLLVGTDLKLLTGEVIMVMTALLASVVLLEIAMHMVPALIPRTVWQGSHQDVPYQETRITIWEHSGRLNLPEIADVKPVPQEEDELVEDYILHTNSLGFRGEGVVPEDVDLVTIGDSMTLGLQAPDPWPSILSEQMNMSLLNLALSARHVTQSALIYLDFGVQRTPDIVFLGYSENTNLTAYCPHDPSFSVLENRWDQNLIVPQLPQAFIIALDTQTRVAELEEISAAEEVVIEDRDYIFPVYTELGGQQVELAFHSWQTSVMELSYEDINDSKQFKAIKNALIATQSANDEIGARFIVVYIPSKAHVYWPLVRDDPNVINAIYADQRDTWEINDQTCFNRIPIDKNIMTEDVFIETIEENIDDQRDTTRDMVTELGIEFIDLTPGFREAAATGEILYYPYDTHWTQAGNDLAAEIIISYLNSD